MKLKFLDSGASIFVKYCPATNRKGSRMRVWTDGDSPRTAAQYPYDHGPVSGIEPIEYIACAYRKAFLRYMEEHCKFPEHIKTGKWVSGSCPDNRTRVFTIVWP